MKPGLDNSQRAARIGVLVCAALSSSGCGAPSNIEPLPEIEWPTGLTRGVVPCARPSYRARGFDEPTAVGLTARDAFAALGGRCEAPFEWDEVAQTKAEARHTQASIQVTLDRGSAVEVTYPAEEGCQEKLRVAADIKVSTQDGALDVKGRGTFEYVRARDTPDDLGPIEQPAELTASAGA